MHLLYFMRLPELEEPLEINFQSPSFTYGKLKCTGGKKYGESVGQPGLELRNLRNELCSVPAIFLFLLFKIITVVEGVKRVPALFLMATMLHCGHTLSVAMCLEALTIFWKNRP